MTTVFVLFGSLLLDRSIGAAGVQMLGTWTDCARLALATMFLFTAVSHFAELAGAAALLFPPTRFWAACGLIVLLLAMFPANVSAARRSFQLRGRTVTPLWLETQG